MRLLSLMLLGLVAACHPPEPPRKLEPQVMTPGFNPYKQMQVTPNAARITIESERTRSLFGYNHAAGEVYLEFLDPAVEPPRSAQALPTDMKLGVFDRSAGMFTREVTEGRYLLKACGKFQQKKEWLGHYLEKKANKAAGLETDRYEIVDKCASQLIDAKANTLYVYTYSREQGLFDDEEEPQLKADRIIQF